MKFSLINRVRSFRYRNHLLGVVVVGLVIAMGVIFPSSAWATSGFIMNTLAKAIYMIFFQFAALLVTLAGSLLDFVVTIESFDVPVVQLGWQVVRDICNMGFILILLVIAFGTILRIPAYSARQLLPRLIAGALLINFSKTIAFVVINLSQILMRAFLAPFGVGAGAGIASKMRLEQAVVKAVKLSNSGTVDVDKITGQYITAILFGTVFMFIAAFVLFSYAIVLVVRVVALWILVTLSPLAFVLGILPQGQPLAQKWWKKFGDQVLVGPAVAFFLYMALVSLHTVGQIKGPSGNVASLSTLVPGQSVNLAADMSLLLQFVFTVAFLLAGLGAARQMSTEGMKLADKAVKGGRSLLKNYGGIGYVAKGVRSARNAGAGLRQDLKDIGSAAGTAAKVATAPVRVPLAGVAAVRERGLRGATKEAFRSMKEAVVGSPMKRFSEQSKEMSAASKELQDSGLTSTGHATDIVLRDARSGDDASRRKAQAAAIQIAQNGDQQSYTEDMTARAFDTSSSEYNSAWAQQLRDDYDKTYIDPATGTRGSKSIEDVYKDGELTVDPSMFGNVIKAQFGYDSNNKNARPNVEIANMMTKMSDVAAAKGDAAYSRMTSIDKSTGNMHIDTDAGGRISADSRAQATVKRFESQGADKSVPTLTADMLVTMKMDPATGKMQPAGLSDAGREILRSWSEGHNEVMKKFGRVDMQKQIVDLFNSPDTAIQASIEGEMLANPAVGQMVATASGGTVTTSGGTTFNPVS